MNIYSRYFSSIVAIVVLVVSPQAAARDFVGFQSTTPLLYRYAACVFMDGHRSAEAQIENCARLKFELDQESNAIIARFHTSKRSDVRRELLKGFQEIDKDVHQTRKENKPVPNSIVSYLGCMGESVMSTEDYKNGNAISYIGIEDECFSSSIGAVIEQVGDREKDTIDILYRRFQRFGRLTYPQLRTAQRRSKGGVRLAPARMFDRSFLNVSLMRKSKDD